MSSVVSARALSVAQRTTEATQQAADLLQLTDVKRLGAAPTLAVVEGVRRNASFAAHVRTLYEELAPKPRSTRNTQTARRAKLVAPDVELVPIKSMEGRQFDPVAPPDPYFLYEFYGAAQLPLALERYTVPRLQKAVKLVKERNPRTKPNGTSRQAVIDYIVEYVAQT